MPESGGTKRFGTFNGVFVPCVVTIFGVILFLRVDFIVGTSGLFHGLLILLVAEITTGLTGLSMSAISTNTEVGPGGPYYMISRSLGAETGAAVGIAFFLGRSVSISLYILGFTETLVAAVGSPALQAYSPVISLVACLVLFLCAYVGADWAMKIQFLIFACLVVSLAAFLFGGVPGFSTDVLSGNLSPAYGPGGGFWGMFALFFPATVGIMAGANMSGDLKEPAKSIPLGTLAAIVVTGAFYAVEMLLFAGCASREDLVSGAIVMERISPVPALVTVGIFSATLSSALSSFVGAPRVLQALSADRIFRVLRPFSRTSGKRNEPRPAIVASLLVALVGLGVGSLNTVAVVLTVFFLITFGLINWATFYEAAAANPSFRPRFKLFHWSTALAGAVASVAVMVLISPLATAGSVLASVAVIWYVKHKRVKVYWGDARRGFLLMRIRNNLLRLQELPYHPKNWRPIVLVFSGNPERRKNLVRFADWLEGGRGICTVVDIARGEFGAVIEKRRELEEHMRSFVRASGAEVFAEVVAAPDLETGVLCTTQAAGLGAVRPNTVLFGWCEDPGNRPAYGRVVRLLEELDRSVVALKCDSLPDGARFDRIDVWWRGRRNGSLMLMCAHLLRMNEEWANARIRIVRAVRSEKLRGAAGAELAELIDRSRIDAEAAVAVSRADFAEVVQERSASADLVILGMGTPAEGQESRLLDRMDSFVRRLQRVLVVHSAGDVSIFA